MRKNVILLCLIGFLFRAVDVSAAGQEFSVMGDRIVREESAAEYEQPDFALYAAAAALIDADSGRILYEKNGDTPMAMASTTKIMTCILVLEHGDPEDTAYVSAYAASMPKVKLYVKQGEQYRVADLLYSLMLESHNDTAVVLAEYIGGRFLSEESAGKNAGEYTAEESRQAVKAFANLMNEKAREIGCTQTRFITPNGLDAAEQVETESGETVQWEHSTTAEELARIMAYCIRQSPKKEQFLKITGTQNYSFTGNGRSITLSNHNAFLRMMDGAVSGKTGFTNRAGYCYVGAVERDGRTFVVALLACGWPNHRSYKWSDTKQLMNYGIEHYFYRDFLAEDTAYAEEKLKPLIVENGRTKVLGDVARVSVRIAGREDATAERGTDDAGLRGMLMRQDEKVAVDCRVREKLQAPVKKGDVVGEIRYCVDGRAYRTEKIIVCEDVKRIDQVWCIRQIWERFLVFS